MAADIAARLSGVRERIANAAVRSGRPPSSVRLIAVSKTFPVAAVHAATAAGQLDFGENKVQEAQLKILAPAATALRWHLIGHLQSNKARKAAALFDVIHSIDSVDLLRKVDAAAAEQRREVEVLVQVDLGREPTKHGVSESDLPSLLDAARSCQSAHLRGLMVLPPAGDDPDAARPFFAELRRTRDRCISQGYPPEMMTELSMGMSHDYEVAIEEGATMVRVGTAIFGDRNTPGVSR